MDLVYTSRTNTTRMCQKCRLDDELTVAVKREFKRGYLTQLEMGQLMKRTFQELEFLTSNKKWHKPVFASSGVNITSFCFQGVFVDLPKKSAKSGARLCFLLLSMFSKNVQNIKCQSVIPDDNLCLSSSKCSHHRHHKS